MSTGHLGCHPAFIQEHQTFRRDVAHLLAVSLTLGGNLRPILLGRPEGLFVRRSLRRWSVRHITERLTRLPVSPNKRSAYSSRRASLVSATSACNSESSVGPSTPAGPPGCGVGA